LLKIVVNCGPCEPYIAQCLSSIRAQTVDEWEAFVTVDPCGDNTLLAAQRAGAGDSRIFVHANTDRLYSMTNLVRAMERSGAGPDDVIVVLDGDDWFATPDALRIIAETYRRQDCWMTYGSWLADQEDIEPDRRGQWPAYAEDVTDFRSAPWLGTAVRTWKRWLWDRIDDADFRDAHGHYFRVTEDQAAMMPMLEMAGPARARHIPDVLMIYNRSSPHACGLTRTEEMFANSRYIRSLPPYERLTERPQLAGRATGRRPAKPIRTRRLASKPRPRPAPSSTGR
jgi:glycosyltransferase involved in cell wall biosynthesis